jgi:predicted alpha/beta-fold hydrolase
VPLITSNYKAPAYLPGGDLQTMAPALFRNVTGVHYRRERINTPDDDFLDLDRIDSDSTKVAVIVHGLEASADTPYIRGMGKLLHANGWNVVAMNLRGCSGELNSTARAYHSGSTDDLDTVITHILNKNNYRELALVGLSLGGNLVLKYLGEKGDKVPPQISRAVAISVPCDLAAGATQLDQRLPFIYRDRFLKTLKQKLRERHGQLPFPLSLSQIKKIKTLVEFDNVYTSRMYGFSDAADYYEKCSSQQFIGQIKLPVLILTAKNDPFFTHACLPYSVCEKHPTVFLETPATGGHVGFTINRINGKYYSEQRTLEFLSGAN